jgi:hypothetical protein
MVTTVSTETATATETVSASTSSAAVPTIYMAGDSTMALGGGGNGTQVRSVQPTYLPSIKS